MRRGGFGYNVDQFREAGIGSSYEATKSMTWDSLLAATRKLV